MKRVIIFVVLASFVGGLALVVPYLPWWALVVGFLWLALAAQFLIGRLARRLFLMPFRVKGAALKGASAQVHAVLPAAGIAAAPAAEDWNELRDYYLVDVTITPGEVPGPFGLWEPGELRLVPRESVLRPESHKAEDHDESCNITKVQVEAEGEWADDDGMKYGGPQRLRLYVAAEPGTRELKFRYYLEEFGRIMLAG